MSIDIKRLKRKAKEINNNINKDKEEIEVIPLEEYINDFERMEKIDNINLDEIKKEFIEKYDNTVMFGIDFEKLSKNLLEELIFSIECKNNESTAKERNDLRRMRKERLKAVKKCGKITEYTI